MKSFDETYKMIMEQIEGNMSDSDPFKRFKFLYNRDYLRYVPAEEVDDLIEKTYEMTKATFMKAFENGEKIAKAYEKWVEIEGVTVDNIEGDEVTYTVEKRDGEDPFLGTATRTRDLRNGYVLSVDAHDYFWGITGKYKAEASKKRAAEKVEQQRQKEIQNQAEIASFNTPEYKMFKKEFDDKFGPDFLVNYCERDNANWPKEANDFIKSQPSEIIKGFANEIKRLSVGPDDLEHRDGPDYRQGVRELEDAQQKRNGLVKMIESFV